MKKFDFKKIGMKTAGVAAGAVVAEIATESVMENIEPKKRGLIKIIAGVILPELSPKTTFLGDAASGITASGAAELYHAFKPASTAGVGNSTDVQFEEGAYIPTEEVHGTEKSPLAGTSSPISGTQEIIVE